MKYRRISPSHEAIQWTGKNLVDVVEFIAPAVLMPFRDGELAFHGVVLRLPGDNGAMLNDWILKTAANELQVVRGLAFQREWEAVG